MSGGRFAIFLINVLVVWALMHAYVFWRIASVPWIRAHFLPHTIWLTALGLYLSYPVARFFQSWHLGLPASGLEHLASNWTGLLFLLLCSVLLIDAVTLGGYLFSKDAASLRGWAMLAALALSIPAFVQALRPPEITEHEVRLDHLPRELDGISIVVISDLHLGYLIGQQWLENLVERVNLLNPDILVAAGDVIDGNVERVRPMTATLARLQARLAKIAVTGNHEFYAGADASSELMQSAGFLVLRDAATTPVPGLSIVGVDDLTARIQMRLPAPDLEKLTGSEAPRTNALVLISHTPANPVAAANAGVALMLSGHTHNGQIWPFNFLVRLRYPHIGGAYEVGEMKLLVSRGAGTWGPRMRLWYPGEILHVRLRSGAPTP